MRTRLNTKQKLLKSDSINRCFLSPLGHHMKSFIDINRAQGKIFRSEESILHRLDIFWNSYCKATKKISDSIIKEWIARYPKSKPITIYKYLTTIRKFCMYLRRFNLNVYIPDDSIIPLYKSNFLPHIYTKDQIKKLLETSRRLNPTQSSPLRHHTIRIIILLLYTTGMRISEALQLKICDIDIKNQQIIIHQTKYFKSRIVPLSQSMMKELQEYITLYKRFVPQTKNQIFLFENKRTGKSYNLSFIEKIFRRLLKELGLKPNCGRIGPRIHDLRHTFASHRLEEWYHNGEDVQSKLGLLSTYLGHTGIASTQRYLTISASVFDDASYRFKQYFKSFINRKGDQL